MDMVSNGYGIDGGSGKIGQDLPIPPVSIAAIMHQVFEREEGEKKSIYCLYVFMEISMPAMIKMLLFLPLLNSIAMVYPQSWVNLKISSYLFLTWVRLCSYHWRRQENC